MVFETQDKKHEGNSLTYDLLLRKNSRNSGESDGLATRWASTRRQLVTGP